MERPVWIVVAIVACLALVLTVACDDGGDGDGDADVDGDIDGDVDADADTDADADGDAAGCGAMGETCCADAPRCEGELMCCEGVPYPEGGVCDDGCEAVSDFRLKDGVVDVDSLDVLEQVASLPVSTWSYLHEGREVRHMGPMAQDFHATFELGEGDRTIELVDANGVNTAAIQGLYQLVQELQLESTELRRENLRIRRELDELRRR